jgi:hypothetical protein
VSTRLEWLEIRGFRAFGAEVRRIDLSSDLVVVHAGNSQGKTSLAEAVEFLITGRSSRRDLFGGAKAEYNASLRNAHLAPEADVWVSAGVRDEDGVVHLVRRDLVADFNGATDCVTRLMVDEEEQESLTLLGTGISDGAIAAPVLLQHTLRYVLSTEPKQRALYFKALLTLTDLDVFRDHVHRLSLELQQVPDGVGQVAVQDLRGTGFAATADLLMGLSGEAADILAEGTRAVLAAGNAKVGASADRIDDLLPLLEEALRSLDDRVFPLSDFRTGVMPPPPEPPDLRAYAAALQDADSTVASLLPVFAAVLAVPEWEHLDHGVDCPVCSAPATLTPARIDELRMQVRANSQVTDAAAAALQDLRTYRDRLRNWAQTMAHAVPAAAAWGADRRTETRSDAAGLIGSVPTELDHAFTLADALAAIARDTSSAVDDQLHEIDRVTDVVATRGEVDAPQALLNDALESGAARWSASIEASASATRLSEIIQPLLRARQGDDGLAELIRVIHELPRLVRDLRAAAARADAVRRLARADRAIKQGSSAVLDDRFASMSKAIERWWDTIRPDELVGFAGVKRRAAGAIFVNLMAALQPDAQAEAVERDALGVYSDSQLNALGLATFLARTDLVASPFVLLDDPIPGSDGDHRLTFVQNTLTELLDSGRQVVLTTYDPKLAEYAQTQHDAREPITYDLNLIDLVEGTDVTQTSDPFSRHMLQAEDGLAAPTAAGRREACGALRRAAERLMKQVVATNRTEEGVPTTVADVEKDATTLHDLVGLAAPYASSADEKGKLRLMPAVLNPGNHDDDVPSTIELRQIRGNLRQIAKRHRAKWGGRLAS